MKFTLREDIEAPLNTVFEMVTDFDRYERMAMRRGIEVRRIGGHMGVVPGTRWEAEIRLRGKPRNIEIEMIESDPPAQMRFEARGKGLTGTTSIEFLALSQRKTRLSFDMVLAAKSLPARLLLQSLRLGQSRLRRTMQVRLNDFARELEERHQQGV